MALLTAIHTNALCSDKLTAISTSSGSTSSSQDPDNDRFKEAFINVYNLASSQEDIVDIEKKCIDIIKPLSQQEVWRLFAGCSISDNGQSLPQRAIKNLQVKLATIMLLRAYPFFNNPLLMPATNGQMLIHTLIEALNKCVNESKDTRKKLYAEEKINQLCNFFLKFITPSIQVIRTRAKELNTELDHFDIDNYFNAFELGKHPIIRREIGKHFVIPTNTIYTQTEANPAGAIVTASQISHQNRQENSKTSNQRTPPGNSSVTTYKTPVFSASADTSALSRAQSSLFGLIQQAGNPQPQDLAAYTEIIKDLNPADLLSLIVGSIDQSTGRSLPHAALTNEKLHLATTMLNQSRQALHYLLIAKDHEGKTIVHTVLDKLKKYHDASLASYKERYFCIERINSYLFFFQQFLGLNLDILRKEGIAIDAYCNELGLNDSTLVQPKIGRYFRIPKHDSETQTLNHDYDDLEEETNTTASGYEEQEITAGLSQVSIQQLSQQQKVLLDRLQEAFRTHDINKIEAALTRILSTKAKNQGQHRLLIKETFLALIDQKDYKDFFYFFKAFSRYKNIYGNFYAIAQYLDPKITLELAFYQDDGMHFLKRLTEKYHQMITRADNARLIICSILQKALKNDGATAFLNLWEINITADNINVYKFLHTLSDQQELIAEITGAIPADTFFRLCSAKIIGLKIILKAISTNPNMLSIFTNNQQAQEWLWAMSAKELIDHNLVNSYLEILQILSQAPEAQLLAQHIWQKLQEIKNQPEVQTQPEQQEKISNIEATFEREPLKTQNPSPASSKNDVQAAAYAELLNALQRDNITHVETVLKRMVDEGIPLNQTFIYTAHQPDTINNQIIQNGQKTSLSGICTRKKSPELSNLVGFYLAKELAKNLYNAFTQGDDNTIKTLWDGYFSSAQTISHAFFNLLSQHEDLITQIATVVPAASFFQVSKTQVLGIHALYKAIAARAFPINFFIENAAATTWLLSMTEQDLSARNAQIPYILILKLLFNTQEQISPRDPLVCKLISMMETTVASEIPGQIRQELQSRLNRLQSQEHKKQSSPEQKQTTTPSETNKIYNALLHIITNDKTNVEVFKRVLKKARENNINLGIRFSFAFQPTQERFEDINLLEICTRYGTNELQNILVTNMQQAVAK